MNYSSLNQHITRLATFACLLSSLIGCSSLSLPQTGSTPNRTSDKIVPLPLPNTKAKNDFQQIATPNLAPSASLPAELFTYAPTLSMQEINFVLKGKYIVKNSCLYFVQNDTEYFSAVFYPGRVTLFEDEGLISLNGTKVKLGEEITTGGVIKEYIGHYHFQKGDYTVVDPKDTDCLKKPAVFMVGKLVNTYP
ncbi:hypothetical protein [Psychrobacter sp. DM4]|uniref:hypothetical protein n=1 Tax=Psychrobacter sp. DM4 TaxID=3440637 RepID=UPI003F508185